MIPIKTPEEIRIMAEGGKILARVMSELQKRVKPGISTKELDRLAESLISCPPKPWAKADKITCSFKGYHGFPACLCTSVNEEIVHALPSARQLRQGDIISLDLGIFYKGYHTDMAATIYVSQSSSYDENVGSEKEKKRLIWVTRKALEAGIKEAKSGNYFGDISFAIQKYVESHGFNVVRELCGHGIGRELHEDPEILNYGKPGTGEEIKEGMVFCLEPMVTLGDRRIKKTKDGYGFETANSSLSAHFEHTVAVTKNGRQVLTPLRGKPRCLSSGKDSEGPKSS